MRPPHDTSAVARCRVYTADGGYRWVEFRGRPYLDPRGFADGMLAAARIVDEQVEAEQQLKASLERFEAVVANAPSAISVRDLGHRYTLVNDAFANFSGERQPVVWSVDSRTRSCHPMLWNARDLLRLDSWPGRVWWRKSRSVAGQKPSR